MEIKVGDKVRIIKYSICYCPKIYLGKIDEVIKIDENRVYLKNYKPVPILFVEKVYDFDKEYEIINESVYTPNWEITK